jgi:hypothetical protein
MQTPVFGKRDKPLPPRSGKEDAFMRWAKLQILSVEDHPLEFLIDPTTNDWYSRLNTRQPNAAPNEHFAPVQPGHVFTRARLADIAEERFCLQDADHNIETGTGIESRGFAVQLVAVEVGGVPVELGTVKMWERTGVLVPATPDEKRIVSLGWSPVNDPHL